MRGMHPSRRLRVVGHLAAAVAFFFIAGGHWGALQTVAWAGMLLSYTQQDGSLLSGAQRTFDGKNPCPMCKSIAVAKGKERNGPAAVSLVKKLETFPVPLQAALPPRDCRVSAFSVPVDVTGWTRSDAPPSPIPIVGLV